MMNVETTITGNTPIAITIGNFDGIHRGHQYLFQRLREVAQETDSSPTLVTFTPHTLQVVRPEVNLECLTTLDEKLALAKQYGHLNNYIIIHFTPEVAAMSAREFLDELRARFTIRAIVVGNNFSLGHKRMGNTAFLQQYGDEHGIIIRAIELAEDGPEHISSTRIRNLVREGNVAEAGKLLGHPVVVSGVVIRGDQRGRLIGFPTANLLPPSHKLIPANGVYAARVHIGKAAKSDDANNTDVSIDEAPTYWPAGEQPLASAVNIGVRPTFDGQKRLIEAHLLDTNLDLYDQFISIDFIARLRSEQRFNGIDALKTQIASDVQQARQILQEGG